MTEVSNAAVRVGAPDESLVRAIELPAHLAVHIPALDETRHYDLTDVSDEQLVDMLSHGMSQKLTDAAAGKDGAKALEAVAKREKTVWALTGTRGTLLDPIEREMFDQAIKTLKRAGEKAKNLPTMKGFAAWMDTQDEEFLDGLRAKAEKIVADEAAEIAALAKKIVLKK